MDTIIVLHGVRVNLSGHPRPEVVLDHRYPLVVRLTEDGEAETPVERDRIGVHRRREGLQYRATPLNGDGRPDLVTAIDSGANAGKVSVLYGRSRGRLSAPHLFNATGGNENFSIAAGFLNGDRIPDLAVPDHDSPGSRSCTADADPPAGVHRLPVAGRRAGLRADPGPVSEPPRLAVGEDVDDLSAFHSGLHLAPEAEPVQVAVALDERPAEVRRQRDEL